MTEWNGAPLRTTYKDGYQAKRDEFADRARDGDWQAVLATIAGSPTLANAWRPGGPSRYTPLHQAAWHGASESVVRTLDVLTELETPQTWFPVPWNVRRVPLRSRRAGTDGGQLAPGGRRLR